MFAFVPSVPAGAFTANGTTFTSPSTPPAAKDSSLRVATSMTVRTEPDPTGPATQKYLQFIDTDRLNKAPVITINQFKNSDYNSISLSLPILNANIANGDNEKAGVDTFISDDSVPAPSKYAKYYDPKTLHEAPDISVYFHGDSYMQPTVSVSQSETPLRVEMAKEILDNYAGNTPLGPSLYPDFTEDRINKAPVLTISDTNESDRRVEIESVNMPLNIFDAELILAKYRS